MKKLSIVLLTLVMSSCSVTFNSERRFPPRQLDELQVNSYVSAGKGSFKDESTVTIRMGADSIIYHTYYVDKQIWELLDKK